MLLSIFTWQVPRQRNEYDCGLFMLYYIDKFIQEAPERLTKESLGMVQIGFLHYFC
jgi:Ulp1 family protease